MDINKRANYLRIAMNLQKVAIDNEMAERIIITYENVLKLEGGFSLRDAIDIEYKLDKKFAKAKLKEE
jgi:hypothetical protein